MNLFTLCFSAVLVVASVSAGPESTDWCQVRNAHCRNKPHIGCSPNGFITSGQNTNVKIIQLTPAQKQLLVDAHNKYRNELASGAYANKGFPAASQLTETFWDDDLAYLAGVHASYGEMQHDQCRATPNHPNSGQNLFTTMTTVDNIVVENTINQATKSWFDEIMLVNATLIDNLQMNDVMVAGHFTVMVNDRNNRLGCAISKYNTVRNGRSWYGALLTCNYGYTNMLGQRVYSRGTTASACTNGRSAKFANLCANKDPVAVAASVAVAAAAPASTVDTAARGC